MMTTTRYGTISRLAIVIAAIMVASCEGKQSVMPPTNAVLTPAPSQKGKMSVGDNVAAPFVGSSLYLARVESISGADARVHFIHDNSEETYPITDLRPIEIRTWAVGDSVLAVSDQFSGRFSEGRISAVSSPGLYTITHGDYAPKDVEAKYIIAP